MYVEAVVAHFLWQAKNERKGVKHFYLGVVLSVSLRVQQVMECWSHRKEFGISLFSIVVNGFVIICCA